MRGRVHLCVITDATLVPGRDHVAVAEAALAGGADMIQLRDKTPDLRRLLPQARRIRAACRAHGALFIVNDRLDLALAAGADGVHVGQDDLPATVARRLLGPHLVLGVSTHDLAQAEAAAAAGADYIGFGPMFGTRSKDTGYTPRGTAMLREVRDRVRVPIVAIGGIMLENVGEVIAAGADAPAVISAVAGAADVAGAAREFQERVLAAKRRAGLPA
jgi:thiamine-phosphate pyrophosphorylase